MLVAARCPVHKEQSLSYDIKGIVEQASAQCPPLTWAHCARKRMFSSLLSWGWTHTRAHNRLPPHQPPLVLILAEIHSLARDKFAHLPQCSCFQHLNFKIRTCLHFCDIRLVRGENYALWRYAPGWEEGLIYNSGCVTTNCQRYSSGFSRESRRTDENAECSLGLNMASGNHRL